MKTLYILIDESGNFDFTSSGTKYFVVSGYLTTNPSDAVVDLYTLKYRLLSLGYEQECFHATEDKQFIRNDMYNIITKSDGKYAFVYSEKSILPKDLQNKKDLYTLCIKKLIISILDKEKQNTYESVVVVMDKILSSHEKSHFYKIVRPELKKFNIQFNIYFFQTKSDCNAQLADYGSWARFVSLEREENRPFNQIKHMIKSNINIGDIHI